MGDKSTFSGIKVKYTGAAEALQNCVIQIPPGHSFDGYVSPSAIMDIMNAIPDFDSLSLPDNVFSERPLGDEGPKVLCYWKVVMNTI